MNKQQYEHAICRAAIIWERKESEETAEDLREAVKEYMAFLIEASLPVGEPERPQMSDPGVVLRRD